MDYIDSLFSFIWASFMPKVFLSEGFEAVREFVRLQGRDGVYRECVDVIRFVEDLRLLWEYEGGLNYSEEALRDASLRGQLNWAFVSKVFLPAAAEYLYDADLAKYLVGSDGTCRNLEEAKNLLEVFRANAYAARIA